MIYALNVFNLLTDKEDQYRDYSVKAGKNHLWIWRTSRRFGMAADSMFARRSNAQLFYCGGIP